MRKLILPILGMGILGVLPFLCCTSDQPGQQLEEKQAYIELFNQKLAEIPVTETKESDRKFSPDEFYLFDKLKRMDPQTGEIPPNALRNAWKELVAMFGEYDRAEKGSGYGIQWEERGPTDVGGRTRAAMFDPNDSTGKALFAGGVGGGLWKTDDITVQSPVWTSVSPVFSNVAITCMAFDPSNTQVMYYGTGEGYRNADAIRGAGVWKSTDGGDTWKLLPSTEVLAFNYCMRIQVAANGDVYVGTKNGLYKSTDQGNSFYKVLGQGTGQGSDWITDIEISGDGDIFAGCAGNSIFRSESTLGASQGEVGQWTRLNAQLGAGFDRIEIAASQSDPDILYAVTEINFETGDVFKSTNGGNSWSRTASQPNNGQDYSNGQAWYDLSLEVDPTDPDEVFTGGIHIYRTTDGGATWDRKTGWGGNFAPVHVDQHGVFYNPLNSDHILFTNDGGVYYSTDQGDTIYDVKNTGYNVTQFYSISVNPNPADDIIIGGTQDNGSMLVQGAGQNPSMRLTGADGSFCAIDHQRPDTMYTTYQWQTVLRSRDGGANFSQITNSNLSRNDVMFINPLEIDVNDGNLIYQAARALWRNNSAGNGSGTNWVQATKNYNTSITAIATAYTQPYLTYFAAGGTIYRMPNGNMGNASSDPPAVNPSGIGSGYVSCIAVNPQDENHIVITYASYNLEKRVLQTRNADQGPNATWTDLTGNLPDMPVNWAVFEPTNNNGLLIGSDLGIFRCADISATPSQIWWTPERRGMGCPRVDMLEVRAADNSVHAATHGRGFFSTYSYNQIPSANFGIVNDSVCGGFVQFVDSSTNAPTSWSWDFGDGNSSNSPNPLHAYANSGTYTVSLVVSNPNGTDSVTHSVQVAVLPAAVADAGPDLQGCYGDSIQLSATGGNQYVWEPSFGLSDPNIANPMLSIIGTRTFTVKVTMANGCEDIDTITVESLNIPQLWAGNDKTITSPNDSVQLDGRGADIYSWSPTTGLSCTTCPEPMAYPGVTTTYTLTGSNLNGCTVTDEVTVRVEIVGVEESLDAQGNGIISLSPSPFQDRTQLKYALSASGNVTISVMDLQGRKVAGLRREGQAPGTYSFEWAPAEAGGPSGGVYFFVLSINGKQWMKKAVFTP